MFPVRYICSIVSILSITPGLAISYPQDVVDNAPLSVSQKKAYPRFSFKKYLKTVDIFIIIHI